MGQTDGQMDELQHHLMPLHRREDGIMNPKF